MASARIAAQAAIDFGGEEGERMALVLSEAVTNIVKHGWCGRATDRIELELRHDPRQRALVARIRYPGLPFGWDLPGRTAETMVHALRPAGGLGLLVIHSIADDLAVATDGPMQELTIVRRRRDGVRPVVPAADDMDDDWDVDDWDDKGDHEDGMRRAA
jgi:anti-sigma regulatory factor (Ser/Thr protein kinase)